MGKNDFMKKLIRAHRLNKFLNNAKNKKRLDVPNLLKQVKESLIKHIFENIFKIFHK